MERVLVVGSAGAGKSTVARAIGARLGLKVVHLDAVFFRPGWIELDPPEFAERVQALIAEPRWVMDGNYSATLPLRLRRADTVIVLDPPTWLCLARVLRRIARNYGRTRGDDIAPDCPEHLDLQFLRFVLGYRRTHRPRVQAALAGYAGRVVTLATRAEVSRFLAALPSPTSRAG